jgi:two-component system sensor histidine kinase/response regulator
VRRFEQILSPVCGEAGQVVMAVSTVHDVTERRQAEEALKQYAADLAVRNEDLDTFAHTVAHDLKNPLGNIIGFTEWLQARPQMSEDDRQDYLDVIARNAAKMAAIIDELLLLARVRKGDVELAPLDMERIVGEVMQRLSFVSAKACAVIHAPDRWPIALGHAPWVEEVWVNYLSNAIKYGGAPPHIELGCDLDSTEMIRFWVHDDGPGIPPEVQAQLFAPFTQLSKVRATGSGLGLSIVRQIVEKMGGTVGVKSEPGRGSTFSFTLPMTV